jgi:hypothetical protein
VTSHPIERKALTDKVIAVSPAVFPYFVFFAITVWSLRTVLVTPGTIGHVADWGVPIFPEEATRRMQSDFWVWDPTTGAGSYSPIKTPHFSFSLLTLPFGLLGGEVYTKAVILLTLWISASAMYLLAHREFGLNVFWSISSAIIYTFSPVSFLRLVVGHLNILFGYALLPIFTLLCFQIVQESARGGGSTPAKVVSAGVLLSLAFALHQSILIVFSLVAVVIFALAIVRENTRRVVTSGWIIFMIAVLLNICWILLFGFGYLSSGSVYHGWGIDIPSDQITMSAVAPSRQWLLDLASQPMEQAIRLFSPGESSKYSYSDFVLPMQGVLGNLWLVCSFLLALLAFSQLTIRTRLNRQVLSLLILGVLGVALVSGNRNFLGAGLYQVMKLIMPPVWAEFADTSRASVLISLAYSALGPLTLSRLADKMTRSVSSSGSRNFQFLRNFRLGNLWAFAPTAFLLVIWSCQFFVVDLARGLSFSLAPSEDRGLYDFLMIDPDSSRMTYVPPSGVWGAIDYNDKWDSGPATARPRFLAPFTNTPAWQAASSFGVPWQIASSSKMLGLAAVRYLVYRRSVFFDNEQRAAYDAVIAANESLKPLALPFTGTTILENQDRLPHIYAAPKATMVLGSSDFLAPLSGTPYFGQSPAIIFSTQQSTADLETIASKSWVVVSPLTNSPIITSALVSSPSGSSLIETRSVPHSADTSVYFMPVPTATIATASSFSLPQSGKYYARVKAYVQPASRLFGSQLAYTSTVDYLRETPNPSAWSAVRSETTSGLDQYAWTTNTLYDARRDQAGHLQVRTLFTNAARENPYVEFRKEISPFSLGDFPFLDISSQADDPDSQLVEIRLGLTFTGGGTAENEWILPLVPQTNLKLTRVAVFDAVKLDFPDRPAYRVVSVSVRSTTRPKVVLQSQRQGLYALTLGEVSFRSADSLKSNAINIVSSVVNRMETAPDTSSRAESDPKGLAVPFDGSKHGTMVTLDRSLANVKVSDGASYSLGYQVDGPAALALEFALIGADDAGITETIVSGTRILDPYSSGTVDLESNSPPIRPIGVEIRLGKLNGAHEMRSTMVRLSQFRIYGQSLQPLAEAFPHVPLLKIDDRNVPLESMTQSDDRQGAWFETNALDLQRGNHSVSIGYSDSTMPDRVGLMELAPAQLEVPPRMSSPPQITFRQINPTRYEVHVENAIAPFFLVFSDSFHDGWKAFIRSSPLPASRWYEASALLSALLDGGNPREIPEHYLVNGYANSWYVEQDGTFDISVDFTPQRTYEAGLVLSAITFFGCVLYLIFKKKTSVKKP